jgi:peptide/nickel transport system ATP-binding protein
VSHVLDAARASASARGERPALFELQDLVVDYVDGDRRVRAVDHMSLTIDAGEIVGLAGESGCGKTTAGNAILQILRPPAEITGGRILFRGDDLRLRSKEELRRYRWRNVSMVFQSAMSALNPVLRVGDQFVDMMQAHQRISRRQSLAKAAELLDVVGIDGDRVRSYPHELSGGMRQRVVIAIAMANDPDVIIADEPTTALDVTVQAQILDSLDTAREETGAAMVLITHDLGVIAGRADRVLVMYAGKLVESGSAEDVFYTPRMPYSLGLLGSLPRLDRPSERLTPIPGAPPSLVNMPPGCPFTPRCPLAREVCDEEEPALEPTTDPDHTAACHFSDELVGAEPGQLFGTTVTDREALAEFVRETSEPDPQDNAS